MGDLGEKINLPLGFGGRSGGRQTDRQVLVGDLGEDKLTGRSWWEIWGQDDYIKSLYVELSLPLS